MKKILITMLTVIALCGCSPKQDNPTVLFEATPIAVRLAAEAHARSINGQAFYVLDTHSMEPFLWGGDWLAVDTRVPYGELKVGMIILYRAKWLVAGSPPVCHRIAHIYSDGSMIMSGDNNERYERGDQAVRADQYVGKVVGVYRVRK